MRNKYVGKKGLAEILQTHAYARVSLLRTHIETPFLLTGWFPPGWLAGWLAGWLVGWLAGWLGDAGWMLHGCWGMLVGG
jgi:hypothetical protein